MKRVILAALATAMAVAVVAPVGLGAPATATIDVAFSGDYLSATITASKGVSHYDVVLCDGTSFRVELSQGGKIETVGPYAAEIVSLAVKSATTKITFLSGFSGDCKKQPDPDPKK